MASTTPLRQRVITQRAQPNSDMLAPPAAIIRSKLSSNPKKKNIVRCNSAHSPIERTTPASTQIGREKGKKKYYTLPMILNERNQTLEFSNYVANVTFPVNELGFLVPSLRRRDRVLLSLCFLKSCSCPLHSLPFSAYPS